MDLTLKALWLLCFSNPPLVLRQVDKDWIQRIKMLDGYWDEKLLTWIRLRSVGYARLGANRQRLPFAPASVLAMLDAVDSICAHRRGKGKGIAFVCLNGCNDQPEAKAGHRRTVPGTR